MTLALALQHAALQHPPLQLDRAVTIIIIGYLPISYLHFSIGIFPFPFHPLFALC